MFCRTNIIYIYTGLGENQLYIVSRTLEIAGILSPIKKFV